MTIPKFGPCPFCGHGQADARISVRSMFSGEEGKSMVCMKCGTIGPEGKDEKAAEEAWSRRAKDAK